MGPCSSPHTDFITSMKKEKKEKKKRKKRKKRKKKKKLQLHFARAHFKGPSDFMP